MDDYTNHLSIYINAPRVLVYRKLADVRHGGMDFFAEAPLHFNLEASDPELVLIAGVQRTRNILKQQKVAGAKLRFYVPSHEIAEALSTGECTDANRADLLKTCLRQLKADGHTVEAIEVDQALAYRMTEGFTDIQERPAKPINETWKPWPGSPERYEASTAGRVCRIFKKGKKLLKPYVDKDGYERVVVVPQKGGKRKYVSVAQMVLEAHVGPRPEGHWIAHYDDDPSNNRVSNLRWATPEDNIADRKFTRPQDYVVERLAPNQQAVYWDHWTEKLAVMHG